MESLTKFKTVSLPSITMEHMHKVTTAKNWKHGLAYGLSTLENNEYVARKGRVKSKSVVSELIHVQIRLTGELEDMTTFVSLKDSTTFQKSNAEGPNSESLRAENDVFKAKVVELEA